MAYTYYSVGGNFADAPYDVMRYKGEVAFLSNRQKDMAYLDSWYSSSRVSLQVTGIEKIVLDSYCDAVAENVSFFCSYPIDIGNPAFWDVLFDSVCRVTLLSAYPGFVSSSGLRVTHLVNDVCQVMSAMFDVGFGHGPVPRNDHDAVVMRTPYVLDIVCGRGAAWIRLISDMRCVCNITNGYKAYETLDSIFKGRVTDLVVAITKFDGSDIGQASQTLTSTLLHMAYVWDRQQMRLCAANHDDNREMSDAGCVASVLDRYGASLMPKEPSTSYGWCHVFGAHPFRCVSCFATSLIENGVGTYNSMVIAEASRGKALIF